MTKRLQNAYVLLIIAAGLGFLAYNIYLGTAGGISLSQIDWPLCVLLVALMVMCRMIPIYITPDKTMDISFVPVVAGVFLASPQSVLVMYALSSLGTFLTDRKTGKVYMPLFRTPKKELFNICNVLISISAGALIMGLVPVDMSAEIGWPQFLTGGLFTLVLILSNLLLFILYYIAEGGSSFIYLLSDNMKGMLVNIFCTLCIGALIADIQQFGNLLVLLFLVPLLIARFAYKMYLDSRTEALRTITALSRAIDAKDPYTCNHSERVADISVEIARAMKKSVHYVEQIRLAALLHDVGKIGIADSVLQKPGELNDDEYNQIKTHPIKGREIIETMQLAPEITNAVLYHHRRYDGKGYPESGPVKLPEEAAILAVADTYDAMTSDRPYRKGMPHEKAVSIIREVSGTQLAPDAVNAFLKIEKQIEVLAENKRREEQ